MRSISTKIFFVLAIAIQCAQAAYSQDQSDHFGLSPEEQDWIRANPVVRVGGETDWVPYDFVDEKGQYAGVANDFLQVVAAATGLQFEVETGAWKTLISKMNAGHIDLLPALYYSEARAQRYNFTSKYLQVTEYIFARDDTAVTSEDDLPGKTVAILKGSITVDRFRQAHPEVRVLELESVEATIHAVATYKADLLYDTLTTASLTLKQKSITNIRPIFTLKDSIPNDVFMATRQGLPLLSSIISKVLDGVPEAEKNAIISKWEDTAKDSETGDSSGYGGVRVIYALIAVVLGIMLILYARKRVSVH